MPVQFDIVDNLLGTIRRSFIDKVLTPYISASINGEALVLAPLSMGGNLTEFNFEDLADGDSKINVKLADPYGQYIDHPLIKEKNLISVQWGYVGALSPVRTGILLEPDFDFSENGVNILLEALDQGSKLHGRSEQKIWKNVKRSDIAREIANKHNLKTDVEETQKIIDSIPQGNKSDYELLTAQASEENFEFFVDDETLHFHKRRKTPEPKIILYYYSKPDFLLSFRTKQKCHKRKGEGNETTSIGFDMHKREAVVHKANSDTKSEMALGEKTLQLNLNTGDTSFSPTESGHINATPAQTKDEVEGEAESQRINAESEQTTAYADTIGLPFIFAKDVVEIRNVGKRFSGRYIVKRARHIINEAGYSLTLDLVRDAGDPENAYAKPQASVQTSQGGDSDDNIYFNLNSGGMIKKPVINAGDGSEIK